MSSYTTLTNFNFEKQMEIKHVNTTNIQMTDISIVYLREIKIVELENLQRVLYHKFWSVTYDIKLIDKYSDLG